MEKPLAEGLEGNIGEFVVSHITLLINMDANVARCQDLNVKIASNLSIGGKFAPQLGLYFQALRCIP